uniref:Uncharacterized protein n=1 Tax=Anguilla anguilla TaxID=7936 RepID=A0A0E9QC44_ANGAN
MTDDNKSCNSLLPFLSFSLCLPFSSLLPNYLTSTTNNHEHMDN